MMYLSFFISGCALALVGFSQNSQSVTLVFVSSGNQTHKNYEAVIDDVSYYSENSASSNDQQKPVTRRNTIWLNNFRPGEHYIQVFSIRNGANEERTGSSPIYSSIFTVKEGFDTKIAVKGNGRVQFSETFSTNNQNNTVYKKNKGDNSQVDNNYSNEDKISADKSNSAENDDFNNENKYSNESTSGTDENNNNNISNDNFDDHERHSRKRVDTAIVYNDVSADNIINASKSSKGSLGNELHNRKSNYGIDDKDTGYSGRSPMNEDQFHELYESVRNQWLPGQKMKILYNEFLNAEDNFSTSQAKQLVQLITEEGNRLKLAKAVYPCITDPANFSEINKILRFKTSREELDDFVNKGGKE